MKVTSGVRNVEVTISVKTNPTTESFESPKGFGIEGSYFYVVTAEGGFAIYSNKIVQNVEVQMDDGDPKED